MSIGQCTLYPLRCHDPPRSSRPGQAHHWRLANCTSRARRGVHDATNALHTTTLCARPSRRRPAPYLTTANQTRNLRRPLQLWTHGERNLLPLREAQPALSWTRYVHGCTDPLRSPLAVSVALAAPALGRRQLMLMVDLQLCPACPARRLDRTSPCSPRYLPFMSPYARPTSSQRVRSSRSQSVRPDVPSDSDVPSVAAYAPCASEFPAIPATPAARQHTDRWLLSATLSCAA